MMYKGKTAFVIQTVVIAALYVILTHIANMFGMANGIIQVRISEALTVLPYFTPAAIPGLFIGCLAANYTMGNPMYDVLIGSGATLVAAVISYLLRKYKFAVPIPPIIITAFTIPFIYNVLLRLDDHTFWASVGLVGAGEIISCGVLGMAVLLGLDDYKDKLFPKNKPQTSVEESSKITEETEDNTDNN